MFQLSLAFYVIAIFCSRKSNLPLKPGDAMCCFKSQIKELYKIKKCAKFKKTEASW